MKIKSFIAPNIEKALDQVHKEIGQSALILETRKCEGRGFKGFLGKNMVEVIAAFPEEQENDNANGSLNETLNQSLNITAADNNNSENRVDVIVKDDPKSRMLSLLNKRANNEKNNDFETCLNEQEVKSSGVETKQIDLKPTVNPGLINGAKPVNNKALNNGIDKLRTSLLNRGLGSAITKILLAPWTNGDYIENDRLDINKVKHDIHKRISSMVRAKNLIGEYQNLHKGRKTIAFVGPTGVGKTTTLAKVAAKLSIDNKRSVGVITIDTYRIAAVDQLMAYTEMIDIPARIIHTPKELLIAANEFSEKDYVLIDTTGRSQYDKKKIMMLRGLLKKLPTLENYLVMSSGTRNREAKDIFTNFNILPVHGLIFTKIDEARSFGMFLNMVVGTKLPICCLTNGQEVPDDILNASSEGIADLILPTA